MIKLNQKGFTLVEIVIVAPLMMLVAFTILGFLISLYAQSLVSSTEVNLQLEAQNVLQTVQDDLIFAAGFEESLSSDSLNQVADPNEPSGGWTFNTDPDTLIVVETALTAPRQDITSDFVRRNYFGCTEALESNPRVFNNMVFFVDGSDLYRRYLPTGDTGSLCSQTYRVRSCPEAQASASCPEDRLLTSHVEDFRITYFDDANVEIDLGAGGSPTDAEKVTMELDLVDEVNEQEVRASAKITVRNLNQT